MLAKRITAIFNCIFKFDQIELLVISKTALTKQDEIIFKIKFILKEKNK